MEHLEATPGDEHGGVAGAASLAGVRADRKERRTLAKRIASQIPWFLYIIVVFVIMKATIGDFRALFFQYGSFALAPVDLLYLAVSYAAMAELRRVSKPGVDNTWEAIAMAAIAVLQVIVFVVCVTIAVVLWALEVQSWWIVEVFNNTEFLIITLISVVQGVLAIKYNANTLKRTIDYGASHG